MQIKLKPIGEQTIVITGASSGIGLAAAQLGARLGASVVLAARNASALEKIAADLRAAGGSVATCTADVSEEAAVERIAETAQREFGGFDTWVNCASVTDYGTLEQIGMDEHRRLFAINYFGVLKGSLTALAHLRERGGGAIINIGSVFADRTVLMQGPYCASKHAVKSATDALRMEIAREKLPISVALIKPTSIHTPFPEHARNHLAMPPRLPQLLYDPRLVAEAIVFAAQHPKRQLYVGGGGFAFSVAGRLLPRVTDRLLELAGTRAQQSATSAGDERLRDNLYEPRRDGDVDGHQPFFVRKQSYFLQAQKRPLTSLAIVGGALLTAFVARRARQSTSARAETSPTAAPPFDAHAAPLRPV